MTRTLLMPVELLWRASPARWAAVLTGLFGAGVAIGLAVAHDQTDPNVP